MSSNQESVAGFCNPSYWDGRDEDGLRMGISLEAACAIVVT